MNNILIVTFSVFFTSAVLAAEKTLVIPEARLDIKRMGLKQQDNPAQVIHITRDQITSSQAVNLYDLLQQQQSMVRLANNSGVTNQTALSLRGFGDNAAANTLIMVDGFPLSNPSLLAPDLSVIANSDIERIDIVQGSQGSLWGDQAVGGVVNIITRHPQKLVAAGRLGLGNLNQQLLSGLLMGKLKNGLFFKGYVLTYQTDSYRNNNELNNQAIVAQTGFDYVRGTLSLNLQAYDNKSAIPSGLTQAQYDADPRQSRSDNDVYYRTRAYQLLNKHELSGNWMLETRLAGRNLIGSGFVYRPFQRDEWQHDFRSRIVGKLGSTKLTFGYDLQRSSYWLENALADDSVTAVQHSVYLQTAIPIGRYVEITLGGRTAWQRSRVRSLSRPEMAPQDQVFVSEQGFNFRPTSEWRFFIRRDGNFSFPKANQQTWTVDGASPLLPQVGVSYEVGACRETAQQTTQLGIYQLELQNEIAYDPTATEANPFGFYRNFAKTRRRGFFLAERYQMTAKLAVNMQFNYVAARFKQGTFTGNTIPAVPAYNTNLGLHYRMTPSWQAHYDAIYIGSRYASDNDANIDTQLPGYWLSSIGIQYTLRSFKVGFNVTNLFNQKYPVYTLFNPANKSNIYYPGAGRNFMLTISTEI